MINDFLSWSLNENAQAAKSLLVKNFEEKSGKKVEDEEFKKKIWSNPKYLEIKEYVEREAKVPGLVYPFTKFYVIEKCPLDRLKNIMVNLKSVDAKALPLGNVDAYAKITDNLGNIKGGGAPGYEKLEDDVNELLAKKKLKKAYDEMTPRMKDMFKKLVRENSPLIDRLQTAVQKLMSLPPKVSEKGEEIHAWKTWAGTGERGAGGMGKYDDPKFSTPLEAFKTLVEDAENVVANWGKGFYDKLEQLKKLGNAVRIFYADAGFIVSSARSVKTQQACSGDSSVCINDAPSFWSYVGKGRIQINVLNYNLPPTDPRTLIAMTVEKSGRVYHAQDFRNRGNIDYHSKTYDVLLKDEGFPQSLIDAVKNNFKDEIETMETLSEVFKMIDTKKLDNALKTITYYEREKMHGNVQIDSEESHDLGELIRGAIKDAGGIIKDEVMKWALETFGLFDMIKLTLFKELVPSVTPEEKAQLIAITKRSFENEEATNEVPLGLRAMHRIHQADTPPEGDSDVEGYLNRKKKIAKIIADEELVMSELKKL